LERPEALSIALDIVQTKGLGIEIRQCAILALVNVGAPRHVPELLAMLEPSAPLHMNFLDMVGALIDESQIKTLLPLIFRENAMLSATYYTSASSNRETHSYRRSSTSLPMRMS